MAVLSASAMPLLTCKIRPRNGPGFTRRDSLAAPGERAPHTFVRKRTLAREPRMPILLALDAHDMHRLHTLVLTTTTTFQSNGAQNTGWRRIDPAFPRVTRSGTLACSASNTRSGSTCMTNAVAYRCGGSAGWRVQAKRAPCFPFNCAHCGKARAGTKVRPV